MSDTLCLQTRPARATRRQLLRAITYTLSVVTVAACHAPPRLPTPTNAPTNRGLPTVAPSPSVVAVETGPSPTSDLAPTLLPSPVPATFTPTPVSRTATWWTGSTQSDWLGAAGEVSARIGLVVPGLTLTVSGGHQDFGKVVEGMASGHAPDLIDVGSLDVFAARGIFRKLTPYLANASGLVGNYVPAMWTNGSWKGDHFGVPALDHGPELALMFNQTLAGNRITIANPPTVWDDWLVEGLALTQRDTSGAIQLLGFDPLDGVGGLLDTARDVTGVDWYDGTSGVADLANPTYAAFLQGIVAYDTSVGLTQLSQFRQDVPALTDVAESGMNAGKQLAIVSGYWSVGEVARLRHDSSSIFASTWIPTRRSGMKVQRVAGRVIAIPVAAAHPDDGWAALQSLVGDEANGTFLDRTGRFAFTRSFVGSDSARRHSDLAFFLQSLDQAYALTSRENNPVAGFAQAKWEQAIQAALGGASVSDALAVAQKSTEAELKRLAT